MRACALWFATVLAALALSGCVELVTLAASTVIGTTAIYQRYEDRGVQRQQTEEIRALREEIVKTRRVLEDRRP